jgi:hypothetical protein
MITGFVIDRNGLLTTDMMSANAQPSTQEPLVEVGRERKNSSMSILRSGGE